MAKFTGKGGALMLKTSGATPAFVNVGQVQEIGSIDITADEVEVTTLDAGDYRDYIQGFKDPGESQITVIFDAGLAEHGEEADGLWGIFQSGEVRDWAIKWNSSAVGGSTYGTFQAFIRDWSFGAVNANDAQTASPTLRLRGAITLSDTAPVATVAGPGIGEDMPQFKKAA
jgi:hypothetical protein